MSEGVGMDERGVYCARCGAPFDAGACPACDSPSVEGAARVIAFPGRIAAMRRHPSYQSRRLQLVPRLVDATPLPVRRLEVIAGG